MFSEDILKLPCGKAEDMMICNYVSMSNLPERISSSTGRVFSKRLIRCKVTTYTYSSQCIPGTIPRLIYSPHILQFNKKPQIGRIFSLELESLIVGHLS